MNFETKDSGQREEFPSGMKRDTQNNKPRYDLVDWIMIRRWAELMERGAKKYGERNWEQANGQKELDRFKASALRHMVQYFMDDIEEDHGAAIFFNISGAEMVKRKMENSNVKECGTNTLPSDKVGGDVPSSTLLSSYPSHSCNCGTLDRGLPF